MPTLRPLCFVLALTASTAAQDKPAAPAAPAPAVEQVHKRMASDGLAEVPLAAGLELGAGSGPLALLARNKAGEWIVSAAARGAAATKAVEKIPVVNPAEDGKATTALAIDGAGDTLAVTGDGLRLVGKECGRERLRPALDRLQAAAQKTAPDHATSLQLRVGKQVPVAAAIAVLEVAREAGFTLPQLEGRNTEPVPTALQQAVDGLPKACGWTAQPQGNLPKPLHDGELLVLVDGKESFGEIADVLRACAAAGIWRISVVGHKDGKTPRKLPLYLTRCGP